MPEPGAEGGLREALITLYGTEAASEVWGEVQDRIRQAQVYFEAHPPRRGDRPLDEQDVLLITYGDQLRAPGQAPLDTLLDFLTAHLADLISGIHILPFYPYSSDDGFSVLDYFQVNPDMGDWAAVARIGARFDLMFDAVLNHMSAESEWFRGFLAGDPAFRDYFVAVEGTMDLTQVVRPRTTPLLTPFPSTAGVKNVWTTFSADQVDLNYRNPRVFLSALDVLLHYVRRGARYIRLDAIAFLWKEAGTSSLHLPQTHLLIQLWRKILDLVAPWVILITETNVPHQDNISYFGPNPETREAQLVYNFALPPLVLDAVNRGEATTLARWAAALEPPSGQVTFFNFLASHDGIGLNPLLGIVPVSRRDQLVAETLRRGGLVSYKQNPDGSTSPYELNITYLDAVTSPGEDEAVSRQRFMTTQAIMLALRGVPGIYFHSLLGSHGDRAAAEESGLPRRINRQKLERDRLEHELADPASSRSRVLAEYARLLKTRRTHSAFNPNGAQEVLDRGDGVFGLIRRSPDGKETILCLHNLCSKPAEVELEGLSWDGAWRDLLHGDDYACVGKALRIPMPPYATRWCLHLT